MPISPSELILNADQSIYHLNLRPEDISSTIITVGDPERVGMVSRYFDRVELKKGKREFITHTGELNGKRLSVISTGIGTDNIDIVLNELDALANIDFLTGEIRQDKRSLDLIRIGTSGAIQTEITLNSILASESAIGFDGLLNHYWHDCIGPPGMQEAFEKAAWPPNLSRPYFVEGNPGLRKRLVSENIWVGITATVSGFYGPQGRALRLKPLVQFQPSYLASIDLNGRRITNIEMETSAIYGLARMLGHRAFSLNCILANRANGSFSKKPEKAIQALIEYTLEKLVT